jgi:stalled ribosome rescue protein Dom34
LTDELLDELAVDGEVVDVGPDDVEDVVDEEAVDELEDERLDDEPAEDEEAALFLSEPPQATRSVRSAATSAVVATRGSGRSMGRAG